MKELKQYHFDRDYFTSVVKNDITRLRRELNDVRRGMEWN